MRVRLNKQRNWVSFSLLELVVAVVIIGIIVSLGVGYYRKVVVKAKAGKAKHAISLIAEAEKMYRMDYGVYWPVATPVVDTGIGTSVTGLNVAAVDNDTDFNYSATGAGVINANNSGAIGSCPPNSTISLDLSTGILSIPGCYE